MLRPLRQRSDLYREKPLATAWTIEGVKEALAAKKISARELLADFYRRIEARNPELNAYLALTPERRLGRRGSGGPCRCLAWHRYRRLHPPARFFLRHSRHDGQLRPRFALWSDCLCVLA